MIADARDWTEDFSHENGQYQNTCVTCQRLFIGYKRRTTCRACYETPWERVRRRIDARYRWLKLSEWVTIKIVWALPRRWIYWAVIRCWAEATAGEHKTQHPDDITWGMALKAWGGDGR